VVLSAAYMLSFTRRAFFGPITQASVKQVQDLRPRELTLLCISALLILGFGFFPNSLLNINRTTTEAWLSRIMEPLILVSGSELPRPKGHRVE